MHKVATTIKKAGRRGSYSNKEQKRKSALNSMAVPPPPTTVRRRGSRVKEEEKATIVRSVSIDEDEDAVPEQPANEVAAPASFHNDLRNLGQVLEPETVDNEVTAPAQPETLDASFHDDLMTLGQAIRSLSFVPVNDKPLHGSQNPFDAPPAVVSPAVNNHKSLQTNPFDAQVQAPMPNQNPFDGHAPVAEPAPIPPTNTHQPIIYHQPVPPAPVPPTHQPSMHHQSAPIPVPPGSVTPTHQPVIHHLPSQVPLPVTPSVTPNHKPAIYQQPEISRHAGGGTNQNPFDNHQSAAVPIDNHQPPPVPIAPAGIATQAPSQNPFEQEEYHGRRASQNPFDDVSLVSSMTSNPGLPVAGQKRSGSNLAHAEGGIDNDFDVPLDGQKVLMTPQNSHDDLDDILQQDDQVLHTPPRDGSLQVPLEGEKVLMTPTGQTQYSDNLQVPLDGEKVIMTSSFEDIHVPLDGQKVIMTPSFEDNLTGHETSDDEGEEEDDEDESEGIDHSMHAAQEMLGSQSAAAPGFC